MACVESHTTSKLKHISIGIMLDGWLVLANARCMTATVCFLSFWFTLNLVPVLVLVVAFLFWFRFLGNIGSKNNYHIFLISSTHCLDRSSLVAIYITHAHTAHSTHGLIQWPYYMHSIALGIRLWYPKTHTYRQMAINYNCLVYHTAIKLILVPEYKRDRGDSNNSNKNTEKWKTLSSTGPNDMQAFSLSASRFFRAFDLWCSG